LTEEEFWALTPAQFDALVRRKMANEERQDYRAALICSVLANAFRDKKKRRKPFTPADFVPKKRLRRKQTWQQQLRIIELLNIALGGKDLRRKAGGVS